MYEGFADKKRRRPFFDLIQSGSINQIRNGRSSIRAQEATKTTSQQNQTYLSKTDIFGREPPLDLNLFLICHSIGESHPLLCCQKPPSKFVTPGLSLETHYSTKVCVSGFASS
jgi:hypothetical protein